MCERSDRSPTGRYATKLACRPLWISSYLTAHRVTAPHTPSYPPWSATSNTQTQQHWSGTLATAPN
eukprot:3500100-Prymnesium_polylepis.1